MYTSLYFHSTYNIGMRWEKLAWYFQEVGIWGKKPGKKLGFGGGSLGRSWVLGVEAGDEVGSGVWKLETNPIETRQKCIDMATGCLESQQFCSEMRWDTLA